VQTHLTASSIGIYVQTSLPGKTTGKVIGVTSKGTFLLFGSSTIFLTVNQHLSPFNIILPPDSHLLVELTVGDSVIYSQNELLIPERQLTISLAGVPVWAPPALLPPQNSDREQFQNARQILEELLLLVPQKGFSFLGKESGSDSPEQAAIRHSTAVFTRSFQSNDLAACLEASLALFGLGTGLTPSGDDWLTGFILYHSILNLAKSKSLSPFLRSLGPELVFSAYRRTTWISANRLESALKGWSEGIFISVIASIFGDSRVDTTAIAQYLHQFGHSSGVDTFTGIYAACEDHVV
jgi:hypothetical protein